MAGTYQTGIGMGSLSDCLQCGLGTFQTGLGMVSSLDCVKCAPGTYQPGMGQPFEDSCVRCLPGHFQTNIGATAAESCTPCPPGTYLPLNGSTGNCTECPGGTYSEHNATRGACTPCAKGWYQPVSGATSSAACTPCATGTYQTGIGVVSGDRCTWCQTGKYQSMVGAFSPTQCTSCPTGTFQPDLAVGNSSGCLACGAGYYQSIIGGTSMGVCAVCPAGTFQTSPAAGLSSECVQCRPGKYQTGLGATRGSACISCSAGTYQTAVGSVDGMSCTLCPVGTYQSTIAAGFLENCTQCRAGTYQTGDGMVLLAACTICGVGTFSSGLGMGGDREVVCTSCEAGKYYGNVSVGAVECIPCERGLFQPDRGQTNCSACQAGTYQPFTGVSSDSWCSVCPAGMFSTTVGAISGDVCNRCAAGFFSAEDGSTTCLACWPGLYAPVAGGSMCFSCMSGTYSNVSGGKECYPCSVGQSVASAGASACVSCDPGQFQFKQGASICLTCPPGQYQPSSSSTACLFCPMGSSQPWSNRSGCSPCTPGTYNPESGRAECIPCSPGNFQHAFNSTVCVTCTPGTFSTFVGADKRDMCSNCSAGWYNDGEGMTYCSLCGMGSFTPVGGLTSCLVCPPGKYQSQTGTTLCKSCLPGTYSLTWAAVSDLACLVCDRGHYASGFSQTVCQVCDRGSITSSKGTVDCVLCPRGTFMAEAGWTGDDCMQCPAGTFSPGVGMGSNDTCMFCDEGYFSSRRGQYSATVCSLCPAGSVSVSNRSLCRTCGAGELCPAGYHNPIQCVDGLECNGTHMAAAAGFLAVLWGNCTGVLPCPAGTQCALQDPELGKGIMAASELPKSTFFVVYENGSMSLPLSCVGQTMRYGSYRVDWPSGSNISVPSGGTVLYRLVAQACARGSYLFQDVCIPCSAGTFSSEIGGFSADVCKFCPVGSYNWKLGATACTSCPPGSFSKLAKSVACAACRAGSYQSSEGSTECWLCAPGTYADKPRSAICALCDAGSYQLARGAVSCIACNQSQFSSAGDHVCSPCGVGLGSLDPGFTCQQPSLPPVVDGVAWMSLQGVNSDDCLAIDGGSTRKDSSSNALVMSYALMTGRSPTTCLTTLFVANHPELMRSWTNSAGGLLPPVSLTVIPFNDTFYPALCKNQGFAVLFTVADEFGEMLTDLSGGRAVMTLLDSSGSNVLFSVGCGRLPNDPNTDIPIGVCSAVFCPIMQVLVRIALTAKPGQPPIIGEKVLSPGPVAACPPTQSWMAVVELTDPSMPRFPGDTVSIQVSVINEPVVSGGLVVFRFAIRILGGVTFLSFHSTYSIVTEFVDDGTVLSVVGDSSQGGGSVLGVIVLQLDAAASGVALVAQVVPSSFQFTLSDAIPYTMLVRTTGFSCRGDGYIDMLVDVVRTTSLITNVRRRDLINWRRIQSSAANFPASVFVVAVGNVMHTYGAVLGICQSLTPSSLVVPSCRAISGGVEGDPAAGVRVSHQTVFKDVFFSVWVAKSAAFGSIVSPGGMSARYRILTTLTNGVQSLSRVDATPYFPNLLGLGVTLVNQQWLCRRVGASFTIGVPPLFSGVCGPSSPLVPMKGPQPLSSFFIITEGVAGAAGLGSYTFPPPLISGASPYGTLLLFSPSGYTLGIVGATSLSQQNQLTSWSASGRVQLSNTGASARCVPVVIEPFLSSMYTPFTAMVPVFPGGPLSLQILLSTYTVVSPRDTSLFIPSSTFVVRATLLFSDGSQLLVQSDARLSMTCPDMLVSGLAASSTESFVGNTLLTFRFAGIPCVTTRVVVVVVEVAVRSAVLVCQTCPSTIALDSDPLGSQLPEQYPTSFPISMVFVRRLLFDGKTVDRVEPLSLSGGAVSLQGQLIVGKNVGVSTLTTSHTPGTSISVTVIQRWCVSALGVCNGIPCSSASALKLAPMGDGAAQPPFSYATSLAVSFRMGLYNGTYRNFGWLTGATVLVNQTEKSSPLLSGLVFGDLLLQIRFASVWQMPDTVESTGGVTLRVEMLSILSWGGPSVIRQVHCSGIWEEVRYTVNATLTDLNHQAITPVFSSTPPLVMHYAAEGLFHADGIGTGNITAQFGGQSTLITVTAVTQSIFFTGFSMSFLPSFWNAPLNAEILVAPVLTPWPFLRPWFELDALGGRVLALESSDPSVIRVAANRRTISLVSDSYKPVKITAILLLCNAYSFFVVDNKEITVNVAPSQLGDIDLGRENGVPLDLIGVGQIMDIPVYLFVKSEILKAYMVEIELVGSGVEAVDCSVGTLANSQCAVCSGGTRTMFRAIGAFSQSQLTGRILLCRIQVRVLLNYLGALHVNLLQVLFGGGSTLEPRRVSRLIRFGTGVPTISDVSYIDGGSSPNALMPNQPSTPQRVLGDADGDGIFSSVDVLFMESYIAVSVSRGEQMICVEGLKCQSSSRLTQWQLLQLKPVRNPVMPASRPDGSDVIFMLRALVGKAFFLSSLDVKSVPGSLSVKLSLMDYKQTLNPPNAVARLEIVTLANKNLAFDTYYSFNLALSTLSVLCQRTDSGFIASNLPSSPTVDEPTVSLKIRIYSLDSLGSGYGAVAADRMFLFKPTGPVIAFAIMATATTLPEPVLVEYLPTLNCQTLCDDASLFLDNTVGFPQWINDSAITVGGLAGAPLMFQGVWPGISRQSSVTTPSLQENTGSSVVIPYQTGDGGIPLGSKFNVTFCPVDQVPSLFMGVYRLQTTPPLVFVRSYGTAPPTGDGLFLVAPGLSLCVRMEFMMLDEGEYTISITQQEAVDTARGIATSSLVQSVVGVPALFSRLIVTPLCQQGVILWSRLVSGIPDEPCDIQVVGVLLKGGANLSMTYTCKVYPCMFQGFGQIIRPVVRTFTPNSPTLVVQQSVLALGQRTQWRAECILSGSANSGRVTVNERAWRAGLIRGTPVHALEITMSSVKGLKSGRASINFAGAVRTGVNITDTVNPPKALRAFLFQSVGFSTDVAGTVTAVFKSGVLQAGGRFFVLLKADYRGGYTFLLNPIPGVDGLSISGATNDVTVSQIDGSVVVGARAPAGVDTPIVVVVFQGVTLTVTASVNALVPEKISLCCAPVLASVSSVLYGLPDYPSSFRLEDPQILFVGVGAPSLRVQLTDPCLRVAYDTAVLQYTPSTGMWVLSSAAPSSGKSIIRVFYTHPGSLVIVEGQVEVVLATADQLELSTSIAGAVVLHRIHCSASTFEGVDLIGTLRIPQSSVTRQLGSEMGVSSSSVAVAGIVSISSSSVWRIEGRGVGSAVVTASFKGLSATLSVTVSDVSVVIQTVAIPGAMEVRGIKGVGGVPVLVNWTLSGGAGTVVQQDISPLALVWLESNQFAGLVKGVAPDGAPATLLRAYGNTVGSPAILRITVSQCLPSAPSVLVAESLVTVRLLADERHGDVEIQFDDDNRSSFVVTLVAAPTVFAFYIHVQTDATLLSVCIPMKGLPPFSDCMLDTGQGGVFVVAGSSVQQLPGVRTELVRIVASTMTGTGIRQVWGFVEVYNGVSAIRYSIQAGEFGTQVVAPGANYSVDKLMPSLPVVDTSVIYKRLNAVFSRQWTSSPPLRDAVFSLLLLTGRQRLVDTRLYSNEFELSAMFLVTDRFLRPDPNATTIRVFFHTNLLPQGLEGTVMDSDAGGMWVPASHVMDGWYTVEFRQKIPRLSVAVSFDVGTSTSLFPWVWQVDGMLETGGSVPACPRLATQTATFLATYQITLPPGVNISQSPEFLQSLVDHISCSVQVVNRRVLASASGHSLLLSVALESLARVRQANLVLMGGWLSDELVSGMSRHFGVHNLTSSSSSSGYAEGELLAIEREDIQYINDTRDPPIPCPDGFYFSVNGTYERLPLHAVAGTDCYDMSCLDGYTFQVEVKHCIPTPVTRDIVWVCVIVVMTLVIAFAALVCCVHVALWKTSLDISDVVFDPSADPVDPLPYQPQPEVLPAEDNDPFGNSSDRELYFQNMLILTEMDDLSSMMMMDGGDENPQADYKGHHS